MLHPFACPPSVSPTPAGAEGTPIGHGRTRAAWQGEHGLVKELLSQGMARGCAHRDGDSRDSPFPWSPRV